MTDSGPGAWYLEPCAAVSSRHAHMARERQAKLTKPAGALGRLEDFAIDLAALQATERPALDRVTGIVFAGDHGVTAQRVSPYPSDVTVQMLHNFLTGGAAISVLAGEVGFQLELVDAGTFAPEPIDGVETDKPRHGTRDFSLEPALTAEEVAFALDCGRRAVTRACEPDRADLLIFGEMGIGNTTAAAAMAAAMTNRSAESLVGRGTGVSDDMLDHKLDVVRGALQLHGLSNRRAPMDDVLRTVGGLEIIAIAGATIYAAQLGVPVLIDGFIVSVAALAAVRLNPACRQWLAFAHASAERGHRAVLEELKAQPILTLGMRLGEGSGAAVALPVLRLAVALHNKMATFEEAAVSGREA